MAEEGACPICGFERLQANQDNCPQCDADLTCFKVLDSIPEDLGKPASEHPSSLVAVQREPSIAALEEALPESAPKAKPEEKPESSAADTPAEEIAPTPSSKQESKQSIPETKKHLVSKGSSWNQAAAMLTFAVILIAIVAVFQLYHLRRFESDLQEQSRNQKTALNSEHRKRPPQPAPSSEPARLNRPKADLTLIEKETRLKTDIQKPEKQPESKAIRAETSNNKDKPVSLPDSSEPVKPPGKSTSGRSDSVEDRVESDIEKSLSEHDFQSIMIKTGDTSKSVAATYYGSAKYYPLLIMLNPDMPINLQGGTGSLKILKDRHKAAELYRKNTSKIGNRLYFSYTIAKGDTLKAIAMKFYRSKKMIKSILDLNPDSQFLPGERIRIRLE